GVRQIRAEVMLCRGMPRSTGKATPRYRVRVRLSRAATRLQARTQTANTSTAHRAQKPQPSQNPCQNKKGAATTPGSAAQTQRTARPRGVGVTAEAARSKGCSMVRPPFGQYKKEFACDTIQMVLNGRSPARPPLL